MSEKHQGWVASLSNGETVFQEEPAHEPNQKSSWTKLRMRCEEEGLYITQIQLQLHGMTLVGMQNADGYCAFYEYVGSFFKQASAKYQGIGSVLGDFVVITMTNESKTVWHEIRPLTDMYMHCQMKPKEARRPRMIRPALPSAVQARSREQAQALAASMERDWDEQLDVLIAWFKTYKLLAADMSEKEIISKIYADTEIFLTHDELAMLKENLL